MKTFSKLAVWVLFIVGLAVFSLGCTSKTLRNAQDAYGRGNIGNAKVLIDEYVAKDGDGKDRVIAYLEQGSITRVAGDVHGSNQAYAVADQAMELLDDQPDTSLSAEGFAAITNLNSLPYRGYNYDRVMLNTYRAMNYLAMGQSDKARVELRRAYERQNEAVAANAKRIEKAEQAKKHAKKKGKKGYDADRARQDPKLKASFNKQYAGLDKYKAYANYVNPFAEFLQGLYYLAAAADGSDTERGRKAISRVLGMVPGNAYLKQDMQLAEDVASGSAMPGLTYVIFETGTAPKRGQIPIHIPLFLVNSKVDYVGVNFPRLIKNNSYLHHLNVQAGSQTYRTQVVADMDAVIGREFKNELPVVITKTLIAAGTKAAIAYGLNQATRGNQWANIATRITTTVYQGAANQADLRTWATLPKQFQYARFPTPENRTLQLSGPGHVHITVDLPKESQGAGKPRGVNVVVVRSVNPTAPLHVWQFTIGQ